MDLRAGPAASGRVRDFIVADDGRCELADGMHILAVDLQVGQVGAIGKLDVRAERCDWRLLRTRYARESPGGGRRVDRRRA